MELPVLFLERMKRLLGDEFETFLATYENKRYFGLRVNTLKISVEEFVRLAPFHLTPIPWIDNGFYYEREDDPARHPFYYAGLYYLQEPSAMTPASLFQVQPGERVLDLCAAPGGKATALAAKLHGDGLLVANEISASRAKALLKNLEIFGVKNSFITNTAPYKLAEQFEEFFDKILVDAPCSGEGMFRKDIANAKAWSMDKVEECAKIQREITGQAVKMLRPGGMMLYSTCTFSPEENEATIAYLLSTCPDMELLELPAWEGFSSGMPEGLENLSNETKKALTEAGVFKRERELGIAENEETEVAETASVEYTGTGKWKDLRRCVRIFPHRMDGEGHFLALLKKKGELPGNHYKNSGKAGRLSRVSKEDAKVLREFLKDVTSIDQTQVEVRNGQAYYMPNQPQVRGIPFLRNGLYLGEIKKNRFEPSQSFAMALKKEEYSSCINLEWSDERVRKYLCGETIMVDDIKSADTKGWQLVCVNGYPLGWGKLAGGTLKNKLHAGWRMNS